MQRRSFLKSMLCTAAAAVAPQVMAASRPGALAMTGTTVTTSAAPTFGGLTIEDVRRAMEIMRRQCGQPEPRGVLYVHPDNLAMFQELEGPAPPGAMPVHVSAHCDGFHVLPNLPLEPRWPDPPEYDPFLDYFKRRDRDA